MSLSSNIQNRRSGVQNSIIFWLVAALAVGLFYLGMSAWGFGVSGFPLDDAWIHQTYARNLARSGQLAFVPDVPSTGSTAPLWSLLLSLGYLLRLPFQAWTYALGLLFLALTGWTVARLGARLFPGRRGVGPLAGLFCVFEWHLTWAAVSGMETILFIWLSVFLVERYLAFQSSGAGATNRPPPAGGQSPASKMANFTLGILGGLLILTRPEGLGLIGLVGLDMAYRRWRLAAEKQSFFSAVLPGWLSVGTGVSLLVIPYVGFHLWTTGLPFPNTFYAKQTEYRIILDTFPLWWRLIGNFGPTEETVQGVFRVIFIGAQLLLLPGLFFAAWLTYKERRRELVLIWLWWISFLLLYGLRLPVTYQHGRYQIPAIVWVILLGLWGTARLIERMSGQGLLLRAASRALLLSLPILVLGFSLIGAWAYGRGVRFIEREMVATARWLNENTGPEVLIAAHDIGAIGYFTQRPLIDLAGLVTPQVIPFIRDEARLFEFIVARQADRLVTFPGWYPQLTQKPGLKPIYSTDLSWPDRAGDDNMAVYRIQTEASP